MAAADEALGMSLDDLIKKKRDEQVNKAGPRGKGRPAGGRGDRATGSAVRAKDVKITVQNRAIAKPRRAQDRAGTGEAFKRPPRDLDALEGDGSWKHDMFREVAGAAPRRSLQTRLGAAPETGTKLIISNLEHTVSQADIEELFGNEGPLERATLRFDRSGRSEGIAEVVFERRADALKAMKAYNNIHLDGKAMSIELAPSSGGTRTLSSGLRVGGADEQRNGPTGIFARNGAAARTEGSGAGVAFQKAMQGAGLSGMRGGGARGGGARGTGGRSGGRGRGRLASRVVRTAKDLDAELETYMQE